MKDEATKRQIQLLLRLLSGQKLTSNNLLNEYENKVDIRSIQYDFKLVRENINYFLDYYQKNFHCLPSTKIGNLQKISYNYQIRPFENSYLDGAEFLLLKLLIQATRGIDSHEKQILISKLTHLSIDSQTVKNTALDTPENYPNAEYENPLPIINNIDLIKKAISLNSLSNHEKASNLQFKTIRSNSTKNAEVYPIDIESLDGYFYLRCLYFKNGKYKEKPISYRIDRIKNMRIIKKRKLKRPSFTDNPHVVKFIVDFYENFDYIFSYFKNVEKLRNKQFIVPIENPKTNFRLKQWLLLQGSNAKLIGVVDENDKKYLDDHIKFLIDQSNKIKEQYRNVNK